MNPERRMRQLEEQQTRRIHHRQVNEDIEGSVWMVGLLLLGIGAVGLILVISALVWVLG